MRHVTLPTTLATLSLAACDRPGMTPSRMYAGSRPMLAPELPVPSMHLDPVAAPSRDRAIPSSPSGLAHGQRVYRQIRAFCHDKSIAGAPIIGQAGAWRPRLAQGMGARHAAVDYRAGQVH